MMVAGLRSVMSPLRIRSRNCLAKITTTTLRHQSVPVSKAKLNAARTGDVHRDGDESKRHAEGRTRPHVEASWPSRHERSKMSLQRGIRYLIPPRMSG